MLTVWQAMVLGALQGVAELFPISSLGHTVILPSLIGWPIDQSAQFFVIFLVATHLATALVLLGFFWRDWLNIMLGFLRSVRDRRITEGDTYAKVAWLIVVATIPAGLLGLVFDKWFEELFAAPFMVGVFLIGNAFLLYGAEVLRRRRALHAERARPDEAIAKLTYTQALGVGSMQALALFPGFSRTGAALAGGLLARLDHESAARFSFLLATPLIGAAAVLKLPGLLHHSSYTLLPIFAGTLVSALAAYLSIRFLTKYFRTRTLVPFAAYCAVIGLITVLVLH